MAIETSPSESFSIQWHQKTAVITPAPGVEDMPETLITPASEVVLAPLRKTPPGGLIINLKKVEFFGSVFISFLLKCHMLAKRLGIDMVIAGCSPRARELLHLTALDTLWALYDTLDEALEAIGGGD
jgi:anti-sigma B factor antagonist